jgi:hypothetical protein
MRLPNVIGVGIGRLGDAEVIQLLVSHRTEADDFPESIEGFPVNVVATGPMTAYDDESDANGD